MKTIELFAGSRSFSKVAESYGSEVFTTDYQDFENIDLVANVLDLSAKDFPYKPDFLWASPPCTTFSVASCQYHWTAPDKEGARFPKSDAAALGLSLIQKTLDLIKELEPKYFVIENPKGILRKLDVLENIERKQVSYCKYGDTRMKPTDLWSNIYHFWNPREMCNYRDPSNICHHEKAPRGSKTGTQGLKGNYERSMVPKELVDDIYIAVNSWGLFKKNKIY